MSTAEKRRSQLLHHLASATGGLTARALWERLTSAGYRTTLRTVQRDLLMLSGSHPLTCEEDVASPRWSVPPGSTLRITGLSAEQALTLTMAEQFLAPLLPAATLESMQPLYAAARQRLDGDRTVLKTWKARIRTLPRGMRLLPPRIDPAVQIAVYDAVLRHKQLRIVYSPRGEPATKTYNRVHPLALVVRDPLVYLVCRMWDYDDDRQLVLHRIKAATVLDDDARHIADFDIDAYIDRGEFGYSRGRQIKLRVLFDREAALHLYETPISKDQILTERRDGKVLLTATVWDTEELRWWLRGFGEGARVVAPRRIQ